MLYFFMRLVLKFILNYSLILVSLCSLVTSVPRKYSLFRRNSVLSTANVEEGIGSKWSALVESDVLTLNGVGVKTASYLRSLGIRNLGDLLLHLPVDIISRDRISLIQERYLDGKPGTFEVMLEDSYVEPEGKRPAQLFGRDCSNGSPVEIMYFVMGISYRRILWHDLKMKLKNGTHTHRYWIRGKVTSRKKDTFIITNPLFIHEVNQDNWNQTFCIEKRYRMTEGLSRSKINSLINLSLQKLTDFVESVGGRACFEWLPESILHEYGWPCLSEALLQVHNPQGEDCLLNNSPARQRLAFEELVALYVRLYEQNTKLSEIPMGCNQTFSVVSPKTWRKIYIEQILSFQLTPSQEKCIEEIDHDLLSHKKMVRLLQGDVGSGKTVVSLCTILSVVEAGKASIVLAPTEILAMQHYDILRGCFLNLQERLHHMPKGTKLPKVAIITGSLGQKDRLAIKEGLSDGTIGTVVGTHALLQDEMVGFFRSMEIHKKLGLVVIDEEQRFGVEQREKLASLTNVLFATATPIPRSMSLILQGSIAISTIQDKVKTKRPTNTTVLEGKLAQKVIKRIVANIPYGTKVFWVTPYLLPDARFSGKSAIERFNEISLICPQKVGLLHGQMSIDEKKNVLAMFKDGPLNILVCTSIIEVGIDIPDASICVIDLANRFGLSQLHQIRGRVGRGSPPKEERLEAAQCVLLYDDSLSASDELAPPEKLEILCQSSDGFEISDADLQMRGPGEFFGLKQHGISELRIANLLHNRSLLQTAKKEAHRLISQPKLGDNLIFVKSGIFGNRLSTSKS